MFGNRKARPFLLSALLAAALLFGAITYASGQAARQAVPFNRSWLWLNGENAQKASIVVDKENRVHAVFSTVLPDQQGQHPAYYAFCAAGCGDPSNWDYLKLGDMGGFGGDLAIALTPSGQPRVMWYYYKLMGNKTYYYAECDGGCWQPGNWKSAPLADVYSYSRTRDYFGIDPSGKAHFVFADETYDNPQTGTFYASCSSGCTNPNNWTESLVDENVLREPNLKFDSSGRPRIVFKSHDNHLVYVECNNDCQDADDWVGVVIETNFTDSVVDENTFDFEITSAGKPRIAIYLDDLLYYAWCDSGCAVSGDQWKISSLGLPEKHGQDVNLELDRQNRPRLAYRASIPGFSDGLHYSACTSSCETASPTWQDEIIETDNDLDASDPKPPPTSCQFSAWTRAGVLPSLALDSQDRPLFAYGAEHYAACNGSLNLVIKGLRFAVSGSSGQVPTGNHRVFLPGLHMR